METEVQIKVTDVVTGKSIERIEMGCSSKQSAHRTTISVEENIPIEEMARMQYGSETGVKNHLQQYFLENTKSSLRIRLFNFIIKILACVLYCVRVVQDSTEEPVDFNRKAKYSPLGRYYPIVYVKTSDLLWTIQAAVAIISILETILIFYLTYKGSFVKSFFNRHFLIESLTSFPLVLSIFIPSMRHYYIPIFLNCWLAHSILEDMLHDLYRSHFTKFAANREIYVLVLTLMCLSFTGACGIEHLQRAGIRQMDLFTSFYFVMVTFSTAGYGDLYPDWWMSRMYVIILICVAFTILPSKVGFRI